MPKEDYILNEYKENKYLLRDLEYRLKKIEQLMRQELTSQRNYLAHNVNPKQMKIKTESRTKPKRGEEIRNDLLGRLTTLLIKKEFFPSNNDLVEFSHRHLEIKVPNWQKRSRREIIGVIIEEVYALPPKKIEKFYKAASKIQEKATVGEIDDFFGAWQSTIKSLKLR